LLTGVFFTKRQERSKTAYVNPYQMVTPYLTPPSRTADMLPELLRRKTAAKRLEAERPLLGEQVERMLYSRKAPRLAKG
jgi:hypothetical protein